MKQPTDTTDKFKNSPSDDESINFRPSPNFKHMKKYLKFKFEETANYNVVNGSTELAISELATSELLTSELVTSELATSQLATAELATSKMATSKLPTSKLATSKLATSKLATSKLATSNLATSNLATSQLATSKLATSNLATSNLATSNLATSKLATSNLATSQLATSEMATSKLATSRLATSKLATSKLATSKLATSNLATSDLATSKLATSKLATSNLATSELATSKLATLKLATSELATSKLVSSKLATTELATSQLETLKLATSPGQTPDKLQQKSGVIQPPLPPNSPPPDDLPIVIKKEINDDDHQYDRTDYNLDVNQSELKTKYKINDSDLSAKTQETMCRNFIRGNCTKGAACIYVHKLILSQLPGVYRFCRNYQNKGCKMPNGTRCKFIHATVFEKENFFRTGHLPPHTMSHLKEESLSQPPSQQPSEGKLLVAPAVFSNPPPTALLPAVTSVPVINGAPSSNIVTGTDVFRNAIPSGTSTLKREWNDSDDFSSSPRDLDTSEPLPKKCKHCDKNEFRFQYNSEKLKKMMRQSEDTNSRISHLNKKNDKLYTVLLTLMKLKSSNGVNGLNTLDIGVDKEKAILEQLNLYWPQTRLDNKVVIHINLEPVVSNYMNLLVDTACSRGFRHGVLLTANYYQLGQVCVNHEFDYRQSS